MFKTGLGPREIRRREESGVRLREPGRDTGRARLMKQIIRYCAEKAPLRDLQYPDGPFITFWTVFELFNSLHLNDPVVYLKIIYKWNCENIMDGITDVDQYGYYVMSKSKIDQMLTIADGNRYIDHLFNNMLYMCFMSLFFDDRRTMFMLYFTMRYDACRSWLMFYTYDDRRNIFDRKWCHAMQFKVAEFEHRPFGSERDREAALERLKRELGNVHFVDDYATVVRKNKISIETQMEEMHNVRPSQNVMAVIEELHDRLERLENVRKTRWPCTVSCKMD